MKLKLTVLLASAIVLVLPTAISSAQSTSGSASSSGSINSNSLRISPVRSDVSADPGTVKEVKVELQNMSAEAIQARAIVSDFAASTDETGKPSVILEEDRYAPSHSLKRLSTVSPNVVTVAPSATTEVTLRITIPANAKAGGYYGAVRFVPANTVSTGEDSGVAISTNVASLVLLKVNGDLVEKMELASMDVRQNDKPGTFFKSNKDIKVRVRLKNTGNVQVQPFGKVQLIDRKGAIVEEHEINNTDARGNVLPDTIRRFEVDLKKVSKFGKYTVQGTFSFTNGNIVTSKQTIWVVPTAYIIGAVVGLLVLGGIGFLVYKVVSLSRGGRRGGPRRY